MAPRKRESKTGKGTVATVTHEGHLLVRTDVRWPVGATVLADDRPLGSVRSVFGPVVRPFVVVKPSGLSSDQLLALVGATVTARVKHGGERTHGSKRQGRG